jgi:hypothetical protein
MLVLPHAVTQAAGCGVAGYLPVFPGLITFPYRQEILVPQLAEAQAGQRDTAEDLAFWRNVTGLESGAAVWPVSVAKLGISRVNH